MEDKSVDFDVHNYVATKPVDARDELEKVQNQ